MGKEFETEAIVLKRVASGEADILVTLFTRQFGKASALAKGARHGSRRAPYLEPLYLSKVLLGEGREIDFVRGIQLIDDFSPLRENVERLACALCTVELVDQFTAEHQGEEPLFILLRATLNKLCQCREPEIVLDYFKLRLLDLVGYRPELQRCTKCGQSLGRNKTLLSARGGGTVCPSCASEDALPMSPGALRAMRFLQKGNLASVDRLKLSKGVSLQLRHLLREFIEYFSERPLTADRLLDSLPKLIHD